MSLETEKLLFAETILKEFNKQYGTSFLATDMLVIFNHPDEGMIGNITIASKVSSDNFRIRVDIREIDKVTSFFPFQLKVKINFNSGNLNDEIYVTKGSLQELDFKIFSNYLKSKNFKTFKETPKRIMTKSGGFIKSASGIPIETQQ